MRLWSNTKVYSEYKKKENTLFITTMNGRRVLYNIEQAYNMFDMKVTGETLRTVSITYTTTVGHDDARASVIIVPEADHVNTSIWPAKGNNEIRYLIYIIYNNPESLKIACNISHIWIIAHYNSFNLKYNQTNKYAYYKTKY